MYYVTILTPEDEWIEVWLPNRFSGDIEKVLAILSENGVVKKSLVK